MCYQGRVTVQETGDFSAAISIRGQLDVSGVQLGSFSTTEKELSK